MDHFTKTGSGQTCETSREQEGVFVCLLQVAHFAHNWTWYLLLSWLPKYLHDVLGIELAGIGFAALLPYVVPFIFANVGGMLADWVIALPPRHTWATAVRITRSLLGANFMLGPKDRIFAKTGSGQTYGKR